MKRKWKVLSIAIALTVYTVGVVLSFYFVRSKGDGEGGSKNGEWVQSYTCIELTDTERTALYEEMELDTGKLAEHGFPAYSEVFMTPFDWRKELHVIELAFENIYCRTTIYIHPDEIEWERSFPSRVGIAFTPAEIIGLPFERRGTTLRFDDAEHGRFYIFYCSVEPDDALYQEFLRLFFNREDA